MFHYSKESEKTFDVREKANSDKGIFVIAGDLDDAMASDVIRKMLEYSAVNSNKEITVYINSNGGSVTAGMAIHDVICALFRSVRTIAVENANGIAAVILSAGTKGMRFAYPNAWIAIGKFFGRTDIQQIPKEVIAATEKIYEILAKNTGRTIAEIKEVSMGEVTMSAKEAVQFGIVDKVGDK